MVTVVPMPLSSSCSAASLADARVSLPHRRLELREDPLRLLPVRLEEPLERVERELLDRDDRQGARVLAALVAAHAVGDEEQVPVFLAELRLGFRQARLPDAHRLGELGDEELILIRRTHATLVGDAERLHGQGSAFPRWDGLGVNRRVESGLNRHQSQLH